MSQCIVYIKIWYSISQSKFESNLQFKILSLNYNFIRFSEPKLNYKFWVQISSEILSLNYIEILNPIKILSLKYNENFKFKSELN